MLITRNHESRRQSGESRRNVSGRVRKISRWIAVALVLWLGAPTGQAYSVLTHEQVVDLLWKPQIAPMILARFPSTTPAQMVIAHSYAYGGCVIQDMGYYPHGSHQFSNLLHYVRTGDFVVNLLKDATDANEYAFALGALAHYSGDIKGHPAVNDVTALQYPKLAAKYGSSVTYDEDPTAHIRTEFGFDVAEVAKGNYQEDDYRNFIGFNVSRQLLERAFRDTYGFELNEVLKSEDANISSYRSDVSQLIPKMTRVAWASYGKEIEKAQPDMTAQKFRYRMSKVEYEKNWGSGYQEPGAGAKFLAFIVRILPKVGPLKALDVKMPNSEQQDILLQSVNSTVDFYKGLLQQVAADGPTYAKLELPARDLDTGEPTAAGEYKLADMTYAQLLMDLTKPGAPAVPAETRASILAFYSGPQEKNAVRAEPKEWAKVETSLAALKQAQATVVKVSDAPTKQQIPVQPMGSAAAAGGAAAATVGSGKSGSGEADVPVSGTAPTKPAAGTKGDTVR